MLRLRKGYMTVAIVLVMAVIAAGCAASEERGGPGADGIPVVAGVCAEDTPDCEDTLVAGDGSVTDSDLPLAPADDGGDAPASSGFIVDGGLDISEAIAYEGTEVVAVRGFFVSEGTAARLCEALAESFPPQCGGVSVVVTNPEALSDVLLIEQGDTQWSEGYVTVLGTIVDGELTVASNVSG